MALLCRNICQSLLASQFMTDFCLIPALYAEIPVFTPIYLFLTSTVTVTYLVGYPYTFSVPYPMIVCVRCARKGPVWGHFGGENICAGVCAKLFWRPIYCANPKPNHDSQSRSRYHSVMGRRDLQIIWGYDLATVIVIRSLTQPHTCEMGSSGFSVMSQIKVASTTRASFPSILSTEKTNGENICCSW